jgi:hypothetical protein
MLAPNVVNFDGTNKPVEKKHRTITLTNNAPIRIIEEEWPVLAMGGCGDDIDGPPWGWSISIHVRTEKKPEPESTFFSSPRHLPRIIIHAKYQCFDETNDNADHNQTVRVGRLISGEAACTVQWLNKDGDRCSRDMLCENILAVGEELRERIALANMRGNVTYALDSCFANLPPHDA